MSASYDLLANQLESRTLLLTRWRSVKGGLGKIGMSIYLSEMKVPLKYFRDIKKEQN